MLAAGPLLSPAGAAHAAEVTRLLSCRSDTGRRFFATLFDTGGRIVFDTPLPGRGHAIAVSPSRQLAVAVARRPGNFLVLFDATDGRVLHQAHTPEGRHCLGHAVFSSDGKRLYTTENAFDARRGVIGVYEVDETLRRIGEFDSHGIGPHELHWMADGRRLAVANGGILTHPDTPRAKLNLDEMRANLALIDCRTGELLSRYETPERWQKLSIRHLDVSPDDSIALAMQYEGPRNHRPPLVAVQRGENAPTWLHAPDEVQQQMRNYCGSVAFALDGAGFAVTSPRGGIITCWRQGSGFTGYWKQQDASGVAASVDGFWVSDGSGGLVTPGRASRLRFEGIHWDNHMRLQAL